MPDSIPTYIQCIRQSTDAFVTFPFAEVAQIRNSPSESISVLTCREAVYD